MAPLLTRLNEKTFQKQFSSRAGAFEIDAPALLPLPLQRYEIARFKSPKVDIGFHAEVDERLLHNVLQALVDQELEARITRAVVELLHRGQIVASQGGRQKSRR